jgi:hypothetical protein
MRRFAPPVPRVRRVLVVRLLAGFILAASLALTTISAQIPGRNVNMVAGNTWPDGDPYLQRQNEPSAGASTRNPLHLLAGANDYRTVDLPGLADDEIGDAWLGVFKSNDGGQRWTSTLLPGYPQDDSALGMSSPIHGYGAGADPVVRAGTSGLMYYAGLVFDRPAPATPDVPGKSAIFVARYIDNNNKEAGDTFEYLGTRVLQSDPGGGTGNFLDKPWMAVDIPRDNSRCTIVTPGEKGPIRQNLPAGPVYVAYTLRSTDSIGARYDIMFTRSVDCGNTWTTPVKLNTSTERANQGAAMAIDPRNGDVYIAWRQFDLSTDDSGTDALMIAKYVRAAGALTTPGFARKFANPKKGKGKGLTAEHFFKKGGVNTELEAAELSPLDQSTSAQLIRFRTNAYPTMTVDEIGRVYLAWAERGYDPLSQDPVLGSARVLMATSTDGTTWTTAAPVSNENQKGHQLMPSLTYAGGRLMLIYYDVRETRSQSFTQYIDDGTAFSNPEATGLRHTIDLRASMASPAANPSFANSVKVSEYIEGPRLPGGPNVPWQVNPPNLPMFQRGTAPFIGDYVDIAPAPSFILDAAGKWIYNNAPTPTLPVFHAVWTDNRDVRVPLEDRDGDGNPWNDYTPPGATGQLPSIFDPTKIVPQCIAGNAGSRNQNVYTARITGGLLVGSPGNSKTLDADLQRSFVVFVQNTGDEQKTFRLTITNQPVGGRASFNQFPMPPYSPQSELPLTVIEAIVAPRSTASRTVYVTSTDPRAQINIAVAEITALNGAVVTGGLGGKIVLNPDIDNPDIDNPDIDNPDIDNPDIDNAEVYNPDIDNPDIDNPDIDNPDIDNPDIDNPDIDNVEVANPDIDNPDIDNPDIDNPDIDNPDIDNPDIDNPDIDNSSLMTDVSWSITNRGNTTAAYNINLFFAQTTFDPEIRTQLILYRTYKTPVVQNCVLKSETRNVLVANIPDPQLVRSSTGEVSDPNAPEITNATIYLAPGETAKITLRVFDPDPDPADLVLVTNEDGSTAYISSQFVPNEDVTPVIQQQSVNTEDAEAGVTEPPIVVQFPAPQTVDDSASTAENTPVKFNPLANDSTAFGSTKVISFHPAGMASHSGGAAGDIAFQPATRFLYTQRGAVDPVTDALVGRFDVPPGGAGIVYQVANLRTGINYGRTFAASPIGLSALDARPDSPTFHQYLPMPAINEFVIGIALDSAHHRLYVLHSPQTSTPITATTVSAIDVNPGSVAFHSIVATASLPIGLRGQSIIVNSRTERVYIAATGLAGGPANVGGVYVYDPAAVVTKIPNTTNAWSLVVNEAANLVFATSQIGSTMHVYAIDGATNALAIVPTSYFARFGPTDERMVVHEATGKVFIRLADKVVIFDGQRGSPTRNTVITDVNVGREAGTTDIAIDQELGLVITVGGVAFQADIIGVASNALVETIPLNASPTDVAIDPLTHRAFASAGLGYVQEINLTTLVAESAIPVFVESGGSLINPLLNKAYAGLFSTTAQLMKLSGAGAGGPIADPSNLLRPAGRILFSAWHNATNRGFIVNNSNPAGTGTDPGSVIIVDGATDSILEVGEIPSNPFGIGIDQDNGNVYFAHLAGPGTQGGVFVGNANTLDEVGEAVGPNGIPLPDGFTLLNPGALLGFGRHVVVNPANHKVYVLAQGGTNTSLAVLDPTTLRLRPLDGAPGTPIYDYLNPAACGGAGQPTCQSWGRALVIRVDASLNRIFVGFVDSTNVYRLVSIDSATDTVDNVIIAGSHSNRHTASYVVVDEASDVLFVTDYNNNKIRKYDSATLTQIGGSVDLPAGPSAMVYNVLANRIYVSSIDSKAITAIDAGTMAILSSVQMPLVAYFLWVDEIENRIYTSGGDSADESGAMVITDVLGQLGTNVSVTSVGTPQHGQAVLSADYSVTYTPDNGYSGPDQFSYTIAAPTGSAIGTVHINVVPSSPAAVAFGDAYNAVAGQQLSVTVPGPLANDPIAGTMTMVVDDTTDNGVLTPASDGSFTYQANPGFSGLDSFVYHAVSDSLGSSNPVTVTITVTSPTSFMVINTADSGAGSLRQALTTANVESGAVISFAIPNAGPHVIQPLSALPAITAAVTIDGYTQAGAAPNTAVVGTNAVIQIQIRGNSAGGGVHGLNVTGGGSTIRGLAITGFGGSGILLDIAGGNTVEGNLVGITPAGVVAANTQNGVLSQSVNNLIGGASLAARNLLSGNTGAGVRVGPRSSGTSVLNDGTGTTIVNNLIGTDATGLLARPNANGGVIVTVPNVTVGGSNAALRNVVSGNTGTGINAFVQTVNTPQVALTIPSNLVVQGNYIGVRADGLGALANTSNGVFSSGPTTLIGGSIGTTPGGACTGACNVISGNNSVGVSLGNSSDTAAQVVHASATGSIVEGNFIGVGPDGATDLGNFSSGLQVNAASVRVGGTTPAQRNVISGNNSSGVSIGTNSFSGATPIVSTSGAGAIVTGNYIGVDTTGMIAIANSAGVAVNVPNVRIGGPLAGERNIIAGNASTGVTANASTTGLLPNVTVLTVPSGMIVRNNYIGVAVDGATARGNGGGGVAVNGANATIADNVISGNSTSNGIFIGAHFNNSATPPVGQVYTMGSNAVVTGNFIGTNAAGDAALPNNFGISVNAPGATIGGNTQALRNIVSGNGGNGISFGVQFVTANNTVVSSGAGSVMKGNYVGVNANADAAIANGGSGVTVSVGDVTIGGPAVADRNVIGGNGGSGISSFANRAGTVVLALPDNLIVEGNYVGTRADGLQAASNNGGGMIISGANSIIRNNLISGNTGPSVPAGLNVSANWENSLAGSLGTIYASPDGTQVVGNVIGLNAAGTALPNDTGMFNNGPNVTIGGSAPGQRNVIAGNNRNGLNLGTSFVTSTNAPVASAAGTVVRGNYIGLDVTGTVKIVNGQGGINASAPNVTIGGPNAADGNFVANGLSLPSINLTRQINGAVVQPSGSSLVQNNVIGMAPDLTTRLDSPAYGITVQTANNQILQNIVAGNGTVANPRGGIDLFSSFSTGNVVRGNYIGTTPAGLIGLGNFGWGISVNDASGNIIGGTTAADRNVIVGNSSGAMLIVASSVGSANNNVISGNYVGILPNGTDNHNNADGILLSASPGGTISGTTIGGAGAGARNVISGNFNTGISLNGAGVSNTVIAGNYIGVAADGVTARGNTGNGIFMNGAHDNVVGGNTAAEGNVIAFNQINGLNISNAGTVRNRVLSNRIYANTFQALDLIGTPGTTNNDAGDGDAGPNDLQNFPVIANVSNAGATTEVTLDTTSFAAGAYTVQVFANVSCDPSLHGEGERLVGHFGNAPGVLNYNLNELVPPTEFLTATATDANGNTSEFSACVPVDNSIVVSNTNDSGAGSLRAALQNANSTPGAQTIIFNIPGVTTAAPGVISLVTALPIITGPVHINAASQPGYDGKPVIELTTGVNIPNGFETAADVITVTITGFAITRFNNAGVFLMQTDCCPGGGNQVHNNFIGTDRSGAAGKGNKTGVVARSDSSSIAGNVIAGNTDEGIRLENDADSVVIGANKIGVLDDGVTPLPNATDGIRMYDSLNNNIITGNIISANTGWGINIQDSLAGDVTGTLIYGNTLGLDANGNDAGNMAGGIRLDNAPLTSIGQSGAARNTISGNGGVGPQIGVGIHVVNSPVQMPAIRNNYIGLSTDGLLARSNNNKGIVLDGPAVVGGPNDGDGNYISGNGDVMGGAGIIVGLGGGGSVIQGNVIGLNTADDSVGNGYAGITVRSTSSITIGGAGAGRNVISGNGIYGISIIRIAGGDPDPFNTVVEYNYIGTDTTNTLAKSNGSAGINVAHGSGHRIGGNSGRGNVIVNNGSAGGIIVTGTSQVRIQENSIFNNLGPGIDLGADGATSNDGPVDSDSGANQLQNFPPLVSAINLGGTTTATFSANDFNPGVLHWVEFYSSPSCDAGGHGEGSVFQGSTAVVGGAGPGIQFVLNALVPLGHVITATATDPNGNTSEFSNCVTVTP